VDSTPAGTAPVTLTATATVISPTGENPLTQQYTIPTGPVPAAVTTLDGKFTLSAAQAQKAVTFFVQVTLDSPSVSGVKMHYSADLKNADQNAAVSVEPSHSFLEDSNDKDFLRVVCVNVQPGNVVTLVARGHGEGVNVKKTSTDLNPN
jgi:hypothetical protein